MQIYCSKTGRTRIPPIEVGNSASFPARWSLLCSKPHKNELFLDLERFERRDNQEPKQGVVSSEQAEQLIGQGWKFIGVLPNGKVVVEKMTYRSPIR
jgi:hypothetical protein